MLPIERASIIGSLPCVVTCPRADVINACKLSSGAGEQPAKLQQTMIHHLRARLCPFTIRAHYYRYVIICEIDERPCGLASGDAFQLFTARLLPEYGASMIHRDVFDKSFCMICEEVNGSTMT